MLAQTKTTLNYPHEFRPVPRFLLDVPEGWTVVELPGALYAVASVDPEAPWLNIVVSHERITAGSHDLAFVQRGTELAAEYDDFVVEVEKQFTLEVDDDLFLMRQGAYSYGEVKTRHFEVSTLAPNTLGSPINDMITLTFLLPLDAVEHYQELILETVQSFRFA
ncbi:MAG: hypothetical protein ACI9DE_002176 [Halioglobus sp.]|jgi:hypothetical protein|tara:strand:- start:344 stop:835 length:492 start_codon:yes stop_codon:yes gene_type:complete